MLLSYRSSFSHSKIMFNVLFKRDHQILSCICNTQTSKKLETKTFLEKNNFRDQLIKSIHLTKTNNDVGEGLIGLGAGLAGSGIGLAAHGIGQVMGQGLTAISRNPSVDVIKNLMIIGVAFSEMLGLFTFVVAFLLYAKM